MAVSALPQAWRVDADEVLATVQLLPFVYRCERRPDGRIAWTLGEGQLARELHLTTGEIRNGTLDEVFPLELAKKLEEELGRAFGGQVHEFYYELAGRLLRQFAQPLRDSTGTTVGVTGFITEVTKRPGKPQIESLYEQLEQNITQVAAANRQILEANRELEAFAFMVAHDLRSPMMVIDGVCQRILTTHADRFEGDALEDARRMQQSVRRMTQLIDDLLKFSRTGRDGLDLEEVDLSALIPPIVEELARTEPGRTVLVDVQPAAKVRGDPRLLRVAIENLLRNAWKFTRNTPQARIEFGSSVEGPERVFFVRDNGAGFDPTRAHKLFHPFERLHPQREFEGTGIGLTTVQRILRRHGGRVWAHGAVGKGATVFFTLPEPAPRPGGEAGPGPGPLGPT